MNQTAHLPRSSAARTITPCEETRLAVPGMRCAGCISKIETRLPQEPGIVSARVDFGAKQVRVSHLPELSLPDVIAAIGRVGFDAHAIASTRTGDREQRRLLSALAVAGFAAMNIMLLSVSVWSGAAGSNRDLFHWLSALIAIPTVAWSGRPFFASAWSALKRGRTNMDVPISIGVTLATAMSLFETITHGSHAWFDGAVMLLFFLLAGRVLDGAMRERARKGAAALMEASAPGAMVLDESGTARWMDAADITTGATMIVAAGERLAADGSIVAGQSRIDASLLSGESAPVALRVGDDVLAGMLNLDAPLTVRVTAAGDDRTIAALARIMEDAGQSRSRYVRIADRAARLYAPAVHTLAALTFAGWMIAGQGWHASLLAAIAVLIITCPCALGLAVPVAQVVASGALMRRGILVKDGSALERLATADSAIFDKTGTLTLGRPVPVDIGPLIVSGHAPAALALAQASRHPLSRGVALALANAGVVPSELSGLEEIPGEGMRGTDAEGRMVRLGKPAVTDAASLSVGFTREGDPEIVLTLADSLRPDVVPALEQLGALAMPAMIVSGDRTTAVDPIARQLGIAAVSAALPQDKLELLNRRQAAGAHILMVGDGLNDGPALAAAHVSIAPSSASDVGQQAADLVFIGDSLSAVPRAVRAARATARIVRQNFILAIGYNFLAVPLAMAGMVTPLIAAAAMSLSSLIVVGNSLRLNGAAK
mgnify:CR=1 FL=1